MCVCVCDRERSQNCLVLLGIKSICATNYILKELWKTFCLKTNVYCEVYRTHMYFPRGCGKKQLTKNFNRAMKIKSKHKSKMSTSS